MISETLRGHTCDAGLNRSVWKIAGSAIGTTGFRAIVEKHDETLKRVAPRRRFVFPNIALKWS